MNDLQTMEKNKKVQVRMEIPKDLHWNPGADYQFLGDLYNVEENKNYSNRERRAYYPAKGGTHLCPGHWVGYRFAVQNYTELGDRVFDPTMGTGTAIVEAINHNREGWGVELEYPDVAELNISAQDNQELAHPIQGDARELSKLNLPQMDLIINGTPYPKTSQLSSDAPERDLGRHEDKVNTFDYYNAKNIGLTKGDEYWGLVREMYKESVKLLAVGGKICIIIKDMQRNKKPYLLQKMIIDCILEENPEMVPDSWFCHKHYPPTLFISTYNKRFPGVVYPIYQVGVTLRKEVPCAD